ncbi:hypothetical protein FJZ53_06110 [Candidatus Woesearchaeota archaeon]|nr:hypothetical protein [Candidatus Woesearchaeota archaeon]
MEDLKDLKITVSGTRGKSTVVRELHKIFHSNGYDTLSRETGLFPMAYYNDREIFLKRESSLPLNRLLEAKILLEMFSNQKKEVLIFENNAIRGSYMMGFNDFIHPDIVIIVTVTPDHVLDQGSTMEETITTFTDSIPRYAFAVFWTNHKNEYEALQKVFSKTKRKGIVLFSQLKDRERVILEAIEPIAESKGFKIKHLKKELKKAEDPLKELSAKINQRRFVNIGHINDPVHTYMAFLYIVSEENVKNVYVLFNFRADRTERFPMFIGAFLPLVSGFVEGVIVHSDSLGLSSKFISDRIRKDYSNQNLKVYTCEDYKELVKSVIPQIPEDAMIVMVGNTANDLGFEIISRSNLFLETYPILKEIPASSLLSIAEEA